MIRLGLEINKVNLSEGIWLSIADLNFLYFAIFSFLSCIAILVVVSVLTPEPDYKKLEGLTYGTTLSKDIEVSKNSWTNIDVVNSAVIVAIVLLILLYFSPIGIGG